MFGEEDGVAVLALLLEYTAVQHRQLLARQARALVEAVHILRHNEVRLAQSHLVRLGVWVKVG